MASAGAYSFDNAGNQTARCFGGSTASCSGLKTEYTYDGANHLRRAVSRSNGIVQGSEEYWYDGIGIRTNVVTRSGSGAILEMVWFLADTEVHYSPAGISTLAHAHISAGAPVARISRSSAPSATVEYQFHGLANNTLATVAQATGVTNTSFSYAPFGEIIEATSGGGVTAGIAGHNRRFNDKTIDAIDDLTYFGARYYDRYTFNWTQSDPKFRFAPDLARREPRRTSLYTSDLQNPLRYFDPDGRDSTPEPSGPPKPSDTKVYSPEEVGVIEAELGFDPDGSGQFMTGLALASEPALDLDTLWVRLFRVALDESNSDHLTNRNIGGFDGSGSGIAPSA